MPRASHHVLQEPQVGGGRALLIQPPVYINAVVVLPNLFAVELPVWSVLAALGAFEDGHVRCPSQGCCQIPLLLAWILGSGVSDPQLVEDFLELSPVRTPDAPLQRLGVGLAAPQIGW